MTSFILIRWSHNHQDACRKASLLLVGCGVIERLLLLPCTQPQLQSLLTSDILSGEEDEVGLLDNQLTDVHQQSHVRKLLWPLNNVG